MKSLEKPLSDKWKQNKETATYDIRETDSQNKLIAACQALVYRQDKPLPFFGKISGKFLHSVGNSDKIPSVLRFS